jgi:hypothetical protein
MNERIRELAEQATSHMPGHPPYDGLTFDVFDKEKFAELIVRECAGLMDGRRVEYGNCKDGRVILKHFGVEE